MEKLIPKVLKITLPFGIIVAILSFSVLTCYGLFPVKYQDTIEKYCKEYGVDKNLVYALIKAESNFDEKVVSDADAKGLMQLTDKTFLYCIESAGISATPEDIFIPEINLQAGIWYLSFLLDKYDGNMKNAIAAYNAGSANVDEWLSEKEHSKDGKTLDSIPFGETERHVEKIEKYRKIYSLMY